MDRFSKTFLGAAVGTLLFVLFGLLGQQGGGVAPAGREALSLALVGMTGGAAFGFLLDHFDGRLPEPVRWLGDGGLLTVVGACAGGVAGAVAWGIGLAETLWSLPGGFVVGGVLTFCVSLWNDRLSG